MSLCQVTSKLSCVMIKEIGSFLILFLNISLANNAHILHRSKRETTKCYRDLGCFKSGGAFYNLLYRPISLLPEDPKTVGTRFLLYTRQNPSTPEIISSHTRFQSSRFNNTSKTKFIVHGFMDSLKLTNWMQRLRDELLTNGDYNVIIVDWSTGNLFPYSQATANTQVVGAQIAQLVKLMKQTSGYDPDDVHIMGHSLGAHTAGYAGKRMKGIGRITGLDPAGPFFEGMPSEVRLNSQDAQFVDVIHTDGQFLGLGMWSPVGHIDFYPNDGRNQPGCGVDGRLAKLTTQGLSQGMLTLFACNHVRVLDYYIESVNSCKFTGHTCSNWNDYTKGKCAVCSRDGSSCASMGFPANSYQRYIQKRSSRSGSNKSAKFYLQTRSRKPFCVK